MQKDKGRPQDIFRVEAKNHKGNFDLLGIRYTVESAKDLAQAYDDYFVQILDCLNSRKLIWKNF